MIFRIPFIYSNIFSIHLIKLVRIRAEEQLKEKFPPLK